MRVAPLMEPAPGLLLLLFWGYCLAGIDGEGELRCYCNESGCVSTGYMCKSPIGQCYTAVELQGDSTRATHGCLDNVPLQQRGPCRGTATGEHQRGRGKGEHGERETVEGRKILDGEKGERRAGGSAGGGFPLFICCEEDMCNYIENIDVTNIATLMRDNNGSLHRGHGSGSEHGGSGSGSSSGAGDVIYSKNGGAERSGEERDLWFKAAVIAVPIAGGFILVLLVLLAVRMLRTDTQRHRRLIQVRRERSLTKAQLYVTDHFSDVSAKSAEAGKAACPLMLPPAGAKTHSKRGGGERGGGGEGGGDKVSGMKPLGRAGGKTLCRDVNISVDREGRVYEQVQCDVSVHRHPAPHLTPSGVRWGKLGAPPNFATIV